MVWFGYEVFVGYVYVWKKVINFRFYIYRVVGIEEIYKFVI